MGIVTLPPCAFLLAVCSVPASTKLSCRLLQSVHHREVQPVHRQLRQTSLPLCCRLHLARLLALVAELLPHVHEGCRPPAADPRRSDPRSPARSPSGCAACPGRRRTAGWATGCLKGRMQVSVKKCCICFLGGISWPSSGCTAMRRTSLLCGAGLEVGAASGAVGCRSRRPLGRCCCSPRSASFLSAGPWSHTPRRSPSRTATSAWPRPVQGRRRRRPSRRC